MPRAAATGALGWGLAGIVTFVALRVLAWLGAFRLEDHDAIGYLSAIRAFRDGLGSAGLSADSTPFYPIVGALMTFLTGDLESAARAASLAGGVLVLVSAAAITWRLGGKMAAALCTLLVAAHPLLTWLSISVLSESLYVGVVYAGVWLFLARHRTPTLLSGLMLGAIFGCAFLTRFEGLLFLAVVPFWQVAHLLLWRERSYDARRLALWTLGYVVAFIVVSAPHIRSVSEKMGGPALNGRQAWSVLVAHFGIEQTDRAIYGLDFNPGETNLRMVHRTPELRAELAKGMNRTHYVRMASRNAEAIYTWHLGTIAGPILIIAFAFGLLVLLQAGRRYELFLVVTLAGTTVAAPLLQPNLLDRHFAVLVPLLCIVGALGLLGIGHAVGATLAGTRFGTAAAYALLLGGLLAWTPQLRDVVVDPPGTYRYDPDAMIRAVDAVRNAVAVSGDAADREVRMSSRLGYVPFFSGAHWVPLPHADYAALVHYLRAKNVEYVLLEHNAVRVRPFSTAFAEETPPDFELLHGDTDAWGQRISLYRLLPEADGDGAAP